MKKTALIVIAIVLLITIAFGAMIYSAVSGIEESFKVEHALNESSIHILAESISPDQKYIYYEYQFDSGGLGYSRAFWSVIENTENRNNLEQGIIPDGYQIKGWMNNNQLILQKWEPYYYMDSQYELDSKSNFNGVEIIIEEKKKILKSQELPELK